MHQNNSHNQQSQKSNDEFSQLVKMMQALIRLLQQQVIRNGIPELLTSEELAGIIKFHKRSLSRKLIEGDIPEPIQVGKSPRWQSTVIIDWIANGCPKNNS